MVFTWVGFRLPLPPLARNWVSLARFIVRLNCCEPGDDQIGSLLLGEVTAVDVKAHDGGDRIDGDKLVVIFPGEDVEVEADALRGF